MRSDANNHDEGGASKRDRRPGRSDTDAESGYYRRDATGTRAARIADTLDAVPFVTFCNLANINTAMRGGFVLVIECICSRLALARHWTLRTQRRSSPGLRP